MTDTVASAFKIARLIEKHLAELPRSARREALLFILEHLEDVAGGDEAQENGLAEAPETAPASNGAAARAAGDQNRRSAIIDALRAKPGLKVKQLSLALYGDASQSHMSNVRANLSALKKQGRVKNPGYGKWEVTKKAE